MHEIEGFVLVAEGYMENDKRTWLQTTVMGVFPTLESAKYAAKCRANTLNDRLLGEWDEWPGVEGEWDKWIAGVESGETMYSITKTEA
jgi:hypothetical protein